MGLAPRTRSLVLSRGRAIHRASPRRPEHVASDKQSETLEETASKSRPKRRETPGLVALWSGTRAISIPCAASRRGEVIGRAWLETVGLTDERASREHCRVGLEDGQLALEDLGSRNGTHVDGRRITSKVELAWGAVVRVGQTVFLAVSDVTAYLGSPFGIEMGLLRGPTSSATLAAVCQAGAHAPSVLLLGESGVGKELYARAFHEASRRSGAFVAVNCAAIPATLAERLLFGAKEGAFSGAKDAEGYVRAAHRGTLFLDEIGELDSASQPKLLRLLQSREVVPVGSSRAEVVDVRICAATNRDLRKEAANGRFREDLYYRVAQPSVAIPPLRQRRDEVPWLIAHAAKEAVPGATVGAKLVEACLLRPWPGNVRELVAEVAQALRVAAAQGEPASNEHLPRDAGLALTSPVEDEAAARPPTASLPPDAAIEAALENAGGNVSEAARALGLHRSKLRRWLARR